MIVMVAITKSSANTSHLPQDRHYSKHLTSLITPLILPAIVGDGHYFDPHFTHEEMASMRLRNSLEVTYSQDSNSASIRLPRKII